MKKTLLLSLVMAIFTFAQAQVVSLNGIVSDAKSGEPLIGVNVIVEGTEIGTITDLNGHFTLSVPKSGTLKFSYVGYKTQEVKLAGQTTLPIKLSEASDVLDDVVVVGYTVKKKSDVLGAVSKVNNEELTRVPAANIQQALQGRVAGVQISNQTGSPGANVSVRIRGEGSINSSNEPLYIVDGIPVEGALNTISPNDIDNITILKDASSAAIYGSRATNGVVLITTKSGKAGKAKINVNAQVGIQTHGHLTEMANTAQYISLYNEAATNDNVNTNVPRPLIEGDYVKNFANENHLENIFQLAPLQQYEVSASGGNNKTQYLFSGSMYDQDGIVKNTSYRKVNIRSNVNSQVKDWLKLGMNISGGHSFTRGVADSGDGYDNDLGGSVIRYALYRNPAIPVYDNSGNYIDLPSSYYGNSVYNSFFGDSYSPEGLLAYTDRTTNANNLIASGNALVNFSKSLFWKTTGGIDYKQASLRVFNQTWGTAERINSTNNLSLTTTTNFNWTFNSTLNYSQTFGEHSLNYMIGTEAVKNQTDVMYSYDSQFDNSNPTFVYIGNGEGKTKNTETVSASTLLSYFANVNYNFKGKYYLSGILREDGSSRFTKGNRWGTFYSVSGGWNMEQESFIADNMPAIYKLKLRVGYGAIGNQNADLYVNSYKYSSDFYYTFGGKTYNGYAQTTRGNSHLQWETSNQFNAGVDWELFEGELGGSIDYYYKVTNNMLVKQELPISTGDYNSVWMNNGSLLNTGVDLELFYRKKFKDGSFDITLNGGYLHNEVLALESPILTGRVDNGIYAKKTVVGQPLGSFYLYKMDGIFQNKTEILTSAYQGSDVEPGDVKYVDVNGDGTIDANDKVYAGSAIPKFTGGLNIGGTYKGFDMQAFFTGAFGQKIFSQVNFDIEGFYRGFNVTERYYKNHWTGEGTSNTYPRASWSAKSNNVRASTRFLEDGSYVRLKNLQFGYTIPNTQKIKIEKLRVYISATNLFTITPYSGIDPEMTVSANSESEGDMSNGIDWGTYPVSKSYTMGINLTF